MALSLEAQKYKRVQWLEERAGAEQARRVARLFSACWALVVSQRLRKLLRR